MYGTLAGWRAYALERGNSAPADASDIEANAALVRACDYIQYRYVAKLLPGHDNTLLIVEPAAYIAAGIELATPGFFSKTYTEADRKVLTEVKGIKWTVTGNDKGVYSNVPTSTQIETMFAPYVADDQTPYFAFKSIGPRDGC